MFHVSLRVNKEQLVAGGKYYNVFSLGGIGAQVRGVGLNEWHCNMITVFCLYSNTDKVKVALREQVEK